jgi:hypothetical protein
VGIEARDMARGKPTIATSPIAKCGDKAHALVAWIVTPAPD